MSNSRLNELQSAINNGTELSLNLSSNNFPYKLLLTSTQVSWLRQAFADNPSAIMELSKTQPLKIGQSGFLEKRLGPLLKTALPLMGNVLKSLVKSVLAVASVTGAAIHKKMFESGYTTFIISNKEMEHIMQIV